MHGGGTKVEVTGTGVHVTPAFPPYYLEQNNKIIENKGLFDVYWNQAYHEINNKPSKELLREDHYDISFSFYLLWTL